MRIVDAERYCREYAQSSGQLTMFPLSEIGDTDYPADLYVRSVTDGIYTKLLTIATFVPQSKARSADDRWFLDAVSARVNRYSEEHGKSESQLSVLDVLHVYSLWLAKRSLLSLSKGNHLDRAFEGPVADCQRLYCRAITELSENIQAAAGKHDLPGLLQRMKLMQQLARVPADALTRQQLDQVRALFDTVARVEAEIDERIKRELPELTEQYEASIRQFGTAGCGGSDSADFTWRDLEDYESGCQSLVDKFIHTSRRKDTLFALHANGRVEWWNVSTVKEYNAAFNAHGLAEVQARLATLPPQHAPEKEYGHLFLFNFLTADSASNEMRRSLARVIETNPHAGHPMLQMALLHLFLPYYVEAIRTSRETHALRQFQHAASRLTNMLMPLTAYDLAAFQSASVRLENAWDDWKAPIGLAYHVLMDLGDELMGISSEAAAALLTRRYGCGREKMLDTISRTQLHKQFTDCAREIKSWTRSTFAQEHYEQFGFITTPEAVHAVRRVLIEDPAEAPSPDSAVVRDTAIVSEPNASPASLRAFGSDMLLRRKGRWSMEHYLRDVEQECVRLATLDLEGDFFDIRDRLECSTSWESVCAALKVTTGNLPKELNAQLPCTFRDFVGQIPCPKFIQEVLARGVVFRVAQQEVHGRRIGKWEIADALGFFRNLSAADLAALHNHTRPEPKAVTRAKRNFDGFLRENCRFASVAETRLLADGRYSAREIVLHSEP